jgi:hypothetical protein
MQIAVSRGQTFGETRASDYVEGCQGSVEPVDSYIPVLAGYCGVIPQNQGGTVATIGTDVTPRDANINVRAEALRVSLAVDRQRLDDRIRIRDDRDAA